ncbi:MAG: hypothetical protein DMF17_04365 [Verrucomicrobia bacterium]|nr:MAG: hypothetical protein DMF17_04365 [Verrucomicrobiota bacterium]
MRLACWQTRPRGCELVRMRHLVPAVRVYRKDCFGATPKPARETRALPKHSQFALCIRLLPMI